MLEVASVVRSAAVQEKFVKWLELVTERAPGFLYDGYKKAELLIDRGLPDYLNANYSRCETIRTLIKRDAPTVLEEVYEAPNFKINDLQFTEEQIIDQIGIELKRTIVSGLAGSGKSVFLKSLFRKSISKGMTHYPVFFELRSFSLQSGNLIDELYASIARYSGGFTRVQFEFGLKKGLFFLMIDALDEVPLELQERVEAELIEIGRTYSHCPLVLTSRPSNRFSSWEGFQTAHLMPFTEDQCVSFIKKVDYPQDRKDEFLNALAQGIYVEHAEFLSNPLLASMMLLTYDEVGDIPARRHFFYEKCFSVLVQEHDSSKGRYRRQFFSTLDFSQFETVFMYFCALSYLDTCYKFSEQEVLSYLSDALQSVGINCDEKLVCRDLVDSVCILQKDGPAYEFTHRSFQEYFYAKFVVKDRDYSLEEKLSEIATNFLHSDIIEMIYDMDRQYFATDFYIPIATRIIEKCGDKDLSRAPDIFLSQFFDHFNVGPARRGEVTSSPDELRVRYSLSMGKENHQKWVNWIILHFTDPVLGENEYDFRPQEKTSEELKVFFQNEFTRSGNSKPIEINARNRTKIIAAGGDFHAVWRLDRIVRACERLIENMNKRRSRLSEKIAARRQRRMPKRA